MKKFAYSVSVLALLASGSAKAADIYGGSTKDGPIEASIPASRSGFYVTGVLGYAWGDRDISQSITREAGFYKDIKAPVADDYDENNDGTLSEAEQKEFDEDTARHTKFIDAVLEKAPGSSYDGSMLSIPLLGDVLSNAGNDDFNSFVYGAELSYLFHPGGRFAFEPAVGITFYADGESSIGHKNAFGTSTGPLFPGEPVPADVLNGALGQTGYASAEREMDIDLLLRGYYFMNDRFALSLAGGVSIATANVCAVNSSDAVALLAGNAAAQSAVANAFNTSKCDDDTSIGPMIEGGFKWWASDRIAIVGRVDAKLHEFEANADSFHKVQLGEIRDHPVGIYGKSDNNVDVEDVLWTAKVGVSIKLD